MGSVFLKLLAVLALLCVAPARSDWLPGTATFYGGSDGSGTMGGACGYGNLYDQGYGIDNAALSTALFNDGASCGQCYLIICDYDKAPNWCKLGKAITVTATNFCPPNWNLPSDNGGWCNPPRPHFDISQPAWEIIGVYRAGIVPVLYQQVKCWKNGGVRFTINGFNYFERGRERVDQEHCLAALQGQALSFTVTSTGGQTIVFNNVAPASWQFGQTFTTYSQFDY
ncbi:hypothetical protein GUJ93_ZPchr0006g41175 [Zizania palustris]|uniref:Expansin n=1 Tax=Zizania palustris TaxID=103762 RepID=A0A8J5SJ08_ZIZPA|nr:hypothetical protein GUJ93_ZPchr0006g41175 [Zizania palustris]